MLSARELEAGSDGADPWAVLDELPDGVMMLGRSGTIERINRDAEMMIGRDRDALEGRRLDAFVAEEDMLNLVGFDAMLGVAPVDDAIVIFVGADGDRRTLGLASSPSMDGNHFWLTLRAPGAMRRELADHARWAANEQNRADDLRVAQAETSRALAALQEEVRARERLEHELRLAQKLEAIGQLAAGVAHEINTPMQYVGDNVEFLVRAFTGLSTMCAALGEAITTDGSATARATLAAVQKKVRGEYLLREAPKALTAAKDGIAHVGSIVRAMKSFAHLDDDEMVESDINRAIEETLVVGRCEYRNVATVETDLAELPPTRCHVGKLSQVILNLVVNAAHAIADAGGSRAGRIRIESRVVDGSIAISIADNGCGIPEANRHRVYEQFFTTKQVGRGTGQGLSLARRIIVDAHGGTIGFVTEVGVGTTFTITVPIAGRPPIAAAC